MLQQSYQIWHNKPVLYPKPKGTLNVFTSTVSMLTIQATVTKFAKIG